MADWVFPDYQGGSIVNLMSSIRAAYGDRPGIYPVSRDLAPDRLQQARTVVLLVIDGLGYEYLIRHGAGSVLHQHLRQRITSVAPPTTATAITTFLTGLAPQQHGLTGWFTWFRELGSVLAVLPFTTRFGGESLGRAGVGAGELFGHVPVFERLEVDSYSICPDWIANSDFNRAHLGGAGLVPHRGLEHCFSEIARLVRSHKKRMYLYAYWPGFDHLAHECGIASDTAAEHFAEIDACFARLLEALAGTQTTVIVSADHGFVDVPATQRVTLDAHPEFKDCLTMPLCGEQRLAYAYVRAGKIEQFEHYVQQQLSDAMVLYRSEELFEQHLFGLGEPHPELRARIGDYSLILKAGYVVQDRVPGERPVRMMGFHGGLSAQEMYVPLIVASC